MRATKSYYTTQFVNDHTWRVQKLTPDLEPDGKAYTITQLEGGALLCNCVARVTECRHQKILRKFTDCIGKHPPFDFDNNRFFEPANKSLSEI